MVRINRPLVPNLPSIPIRFGRPDVPMLAAKAASLLLVALVVLVGLPRLIEESAWLPELQQALAENGYREVRTQYLTAYGSAIVSARR